MSESANLRISEWMSGRRGERGILRRAWPMLFLAVCTLAAMPVLAQDEGLSLSVSKQLGYNMGSQIQGTFKIRARGPVEVVAVTFFVDGETLAEVTTPPFEVSFKTGDYAPGWHEISAVGTTSSGQTLASKRLSYQFISSEAAGKKAAQLIVPVLVLVVVATVLTGVVPLLTGRKKLPYDPTTYTPGEPRTYGMLGATVCPKCGRPFGIHWWGLNVSFVGKFDRCPHCGKWSMVRRASREALIAAEAEEYAAHTASVPKPAPNAAEKLREQLDDSRFTDHV